MPLKTVLAPDGADQNHQVNIFMRVSIILYAGYIFAQLAWDLAQAMGT